MPQYLPNTRFSDCWGSAGNVTFYHRDGKCFFRSRDHHAFSGSAAQLNVLEVHRRALAAWKEIPDAVKEEWKKFATAVAPHKPPFDGESHITGHNLFISAYHGFATIGDEHVPEPMAWGSFPQFDIKFIDAISNGEEVHVRFRLWFSGADDCNRYRLLGKAAIGEFGAGCKTSQLRNSLAQETECPGVVEFVVPPHANGTGQLHLRYTLIDSHTGYRCQYKRLSLLTPTL